MLALFDWLACLGRRYDVSRKYVRYDAQQGRDDVCSGDRRKAKAVVVGRRTSGVRDQRKSTVVGVQVEASPHYPLCEGETLHDKAGGLRLLCGQKTMSVRWRRRRRGQRRPVRNAAGAVAWRQSYQRSSSPTAVRSLSQTKVLLWIGWRVFQEPQI